MAQTWTLAYRTGGTANARWHRSIAFATHAEGEAALVAEQRAGRAAILFETAQLDRIGLPEGHCVDAACPCVKTGCEWEGENCLGRYVASSLYLVRDPDGNQVSLRLCGACMLDHDVVAHAQVAG